MKKPQAKQPDVWNDLPNDIADPTEPPELIDEVFENPEEPLESITSVEALKPPKLEYSLEGLNQK